MPDGMQFGDAARAALERGYSRTVENLQESAALAADAAAAVQSRVKESLDKVVRYADAVTAFGNANIDAAIKSGQAFAAGVQAISLDTLKRAQGRVETAMGTGKTLGAAQSVKEFGTIVAAHARQMLHDTVTESGKLAEDGLKVAEDAMAPLVARARAVLDWRV